MRWLLVVTFVASAAAELFAAPVRPGTTLQRGETAEQIAALWQTGLEAFRAARKPYRRGPEAFALPDDHPAAILPFNHRAPSPSAFSP